MQGKDHAAGTALSYGYFKSRERIYCLDLSRQPVFKSDPFLSQKIRLRGTPTAAGRLFSSFSKTSMT